MGLSRCFCTFLISMFNAKRARFLNPGKDVIIHNNSERKDEATS